MNTVALKPGRDVALLVTDVPVPGGGDFDPRDFDPRDFNTTPPREGRDFDPTDFDSRDFKT